MTYKGYIWIIYPGVSRKKKKITLVYSWLLQKKIGSQASRMTETFQPLLWFTVKNSVFTSIKIRLVFLMTVFQE